MATPSAIVTGAGTGIGSATARKSSRSSDFDLTLVGRRSANR